jgi:putative aldouronate transport system permease protein
MSQMPDSVQLHYKTRNNGWSTVSLVFLSMVLLFHIMQFGRELIISFQALNITRGISDSPWVGFQNYSTLLSSFTFGKVLRNTLNFNLLFSGMSFVLVVLVGYLLNSLPKLITRVITAFMGLLLFLPAEVFSGWIIHLIGTDILVNPVSMQYFYPFLCTVKYLGIPLILISTRNEIYSEGDNLIPIKVAGLYSLASLAFVSKSFYTIANAFTNPLNYETMDMLDTYSYRTGLLQADMSMSAAVGVIQTLITIISIAVLFVPILALFRSIFNGKIKDTFKESYTVRWIPSVVALVMFAAVYFLPYLNRGYSFDLTLLGEQINLTKTIFVFIIVSAISALIASELATAMSGAFLSTNRSIKIVAAILLTFTTVLYISPIRYSSYSLIRNLGLFNTVFAVIVSTLFSSAAVWAMICMLRDEPTPNGKSLFLSMMGLFLIQTALVYGNSTVHLVYLTETQMSPLLILRQLFQVVGEPLDRGAVGFYGFLVSLPPLLLFLVANILLPRDKMLAVISAGVKR